MRFDLVRSIIVLDSFYLHSSKPRNRNDSRFNSIHIGKHSVIFGMNNDKAITHFLSPFAPFGRTGCKGTSQQHNYMLLLRTQFLPSWMMEQSSGRLSRIDKTT